MSACLTKITKDLANNLSEKSNELVKVERLIERMEFFKWCPQHERNRLKYLIEEIAISSAGLRNFIEILSGV